MGGVSDINVGLRSNKLMVDLTKDNFWLLNVALRQFFLNFLKVEIFQIPSCHILDKVNENYDKK